MAIPHMTSGVWTTAELGEHGLGRTRIDRFLADGRLTRVRRGWYAEPGASPAVVRAVAAGGAMSCVSALGFHGVWNPRPGELHVRIDHNRVGPPPDGVLRCHPVGDDLAAPRSAVDDVSTALQCAWRCLTSEEFVTVADSLTHLGIARREDIAACLGPLDRRETVLARCDNAESGTETLVRLRLRGLGVRVRTQVWLGGIGRVDLLVGERLVIEVDSRAHHTGEEHYASDRRRDLALRAAGYIVVRLTYAQVIHDWPATEAALLAMVRREDHLWRRHRGRPAA